MSGVHICAPVADAVNLRRMLCHTCERPTYFVTAHYEWYGWSVTCLRCGERWNDGERQERPFERGWRRHSIEQASAFYRRHRAASVRSSVPPEGAAPAEKHLAGGAA